MTPAQTTKHWNTWREVTIANRWRSMKGRLIEEASLSRENSEQHRKVWAYAEQLALQEHRAVTVNDLRHACYILATGKNLSHADLTNAQFNRLLTLWALLIDHENLSAQMDWANPERAERRGLVQFIRKKAPGEAYIKAITTRKHNTEHWEDLPMNQLRQLSMTIAGRARNQERSRRVAAQPF